MAIFNSYVKLPEGMYNYGALTSLMHMLRTPKIIPTFGQQK